MSRNATPVALTIAGADPSGGAGIQSDLKTFAHWQVYGLSVITALTVQNTLGVEAVMDIPAEFVGRQLESILADIQPHALKTGMLANTETILVVSDAVRRHHIPAVVVDPVLSSTSGAPLLAPEALEALRRELVPLAAILTPNLAEAMALTGLPVSNVSEMEEAARVLAGLGTKHVLVKGGHLNGDAVDVFFDGRQFTHFSSARIPGPEVHGTGCLLSAAVAAQLARGVSVADSVARGKQFVTAAIRNALFIGRGSGLADTSGF
jgi:hydroxymethylpyrimidine/phosphomethylpyrimidine kinase